MSKYRKKPVVIDAVQWTGNNQAVVFKFSGDNETWEYYNDVVQIPTLEGDMVASKNDFIIKGVAGEFYPCKPDIFHKTYEAI